MKCKKLQRIYFKYIDGRLSKRRSQLVENHIRQCSDCAAELGSLEKLRSLLRNAGNVEMPDTYWDTYWGRLQEKLPDEPLPVSLESRMFRSIADLVRQPAVLGRVAVYLIFLAFLIHTMSGRFHEVPSPLLKAARKPAEVAEVRESVGIGLGETRKGIRAETEQAGRAIAPSSRQFRSRAEAGDTMAEADGLARSKDKMYDLPVEHAADGSQLADLASKSRAPQAGETDVTEEKKPGPAVPMKPETSPEAGLGFALKEQEDAKGIELDLAEVEDEYLLAENYFKEGEYAQAIPAYQNFVIANTIANVQDDRTLKARYQIGEAYYQMGNYPDALSNFIAVTDEKEAEAPEEAGFQDRYEWEDAPALRARATTEAKAELSEVSRGEPVSERIVDDARRDEEFTTTREELISQAIYRQAQSYEHLQRTEEALKTYNRYLERYPEGKYISQAREKIAKIRAGLQEKRTERK